VGSAFSKLWVRCNFAGARTLGFRDRKAMFADAALPDFPFDFPETAAGEFEAESKAGKSLFRYQRRPPAKRPNFGLLAVAGPHAPAWHVAAASPPREPATEFRPSVCRPELAALLRQRTPFAACSFLAVTLRCPGRGVPKDLCHLFRPRPGDFPMLRSTTAASAVDGKGRRGKGKEVVQALERSPAACPGTCCWEDVKLEEPRHLAMRRSRARQRAQNAANGLAEARPAPPPMPTLRPLIGFATSGCFSNRHGCGAGVGALAAEAFSEIAREQLAARSPADSISSDCRRITPRQWVLLWARNTTSLVYFPVWARCLPEDTGFG
ncbi:unnamed protein product, partial [Polarella glacialis]